MKRFPSQRTGATVGLLGYVAKALDSAALWGMRLAFDAVLHPPLHEFDELRTSAAPYVTDGLRERPERFFENLWDRPRLVPRDVVTRRQIPGGSAVTRRFAGDYVPYHVSEATPIDTGAANDTIWVDHWVHEPDPARSAILMLHGFGMGRPRIDARVLMAEQCFGLGFDVAMMTLPFHGPRAPRHSRYSGEQFASWHVGRLNEAVRQAVHDAWRVTEWLRATGSESVGVLGLSLGGYVTALLAALRTDLAFAIPVVPVVHLEDLPLRLFGSSRYGRAGLRPPLSVTELRAAYRVHSPLTFPISMPRSRLLIVGGSHDGVTPANHCAALHEAWGEPSMIWFDGGHVAPFERSRTFAAVTAHLRSLDLVPGASFTQRREDCRPGSPRAGSASRGVRPAGTEPDSRSVRIPSHVRSW